MIRAIIQVIYGFLFSWLVLAMFGIPMAFDITLILSIAFIPGWAIFNWGWKLFVGR